MVSQKEYFLLSILAYCNFKKEQKGFTLLEALEEVSLVNPIWEKFKIISKDKMPMFKSFFQKELLEWKIYSIDDKRATSTDSRGVKTGFYAVTYKKDEEVVIGFRGSELFPYEEAYKDFIENNLMIGIGKKPVQLHDATNFYNRHIYKYGIKKENIKLTGHSLGGGICQYVAAYANNKWGAVPETVTWDSVGLKKKTLFLIDDFFDYSAILSENNEITSELKKIFLGLKDEFFTLFHEGIVNKTISLDTSSIENINILFKKNKKFDLEFSLLISKITLDSNKRNHAKEIFGETIMGNSVARKGLENSIKFFKELDNNKIYLDNVKNYGHSNDATFNIYPHIGAAYAVDKELKEMKSQKMIDLLKTKENIFIKYHFGDVFVPFFSENKSEYGQIVDKINIDYISSVVRYFLYKETGFSKKILANYYSINHNQDKKSEEISLVHQIDIKNEVLQGLTKNKTQVLYKDKCIERIKEMSEDEILKLWEMVKEKMPSPYEYVDIYDCIIY